MTTALTNQRVRLMREVRFSIDRDWAAAAHGETGFEGALPVTNSWGGWPSAVGIAPYLTFQIEVSGPPDPVTGYLVNIQKLDRILRQHAIPLAASMLHTHGVKLSGEQLLREVARGIREHMPQECTFESLTLYITPLLQYTIHRENDAMIELTQSFEFSAAHRLHVDALSDEENKRVFGKCNNPNGHGHNYRLEVTIAREVDDEQAGILPLPSFEAVVKKKVIDRFDHTHLNLDTAEFAERNPSVENIARVIWDILVNALEPAALRRVRVWETPKTWAEYGLD